MKTSGAGIYFHIPFCKTRCVYCDFFSTATADNAPVVAAYVEALCRELQERKTYLQNQPIATIYFGGGTPSQLPATAFTKIFRTLNDTFPTFSPTEVTLEANPDDITPEYLNALRDLPFNRISLGIQSLNDRELHFLHRRHNAETALRAIRLCREHGWENISVDLMYGLPSQTLSGWKSTLSQILALDVQHLSAYHLTYEEGTPLFHLLQRQQIRPIPENRSIACFDTLIDQLAAAGFEQYEISNFSRPGYRSRHNSGYWNGTHYLGIGASAHSYNGTSRQWNARIHTAAYLSHGFEREVLDDRSLFNDFIITRLRTTAGIDLQEMETLFGPHKKARCVQQANKYCATQRLELVDHHLRLTRRGFFVSDGIMTDLLL